MELWQCSIQLQKVFEHMAIFGVLVPFWQSKLNILRSLGKTKKLENEPLDRLITIKIETHFRGLLKEEVDPRNYCGNNASKYVDVLPYFTFYYSV